MCGHVVKDKSVCPCTLLMNCLPLALAPRQADIGFTATLGCTRKKVLDVFKGVADCVSGAGDPNVYDTSYWDSPHFPSVGFYSGMYGFQPWLLARMCHPDVHDLHDPFTTRTPS